MRCKVTKDGTSTLPTTELTKLIQKKAEVNGSRVINDGSSALAVQVLRLSTALQ